MTTLTDLLLDPGTGTTDRLAHRLVDLIGADRLSAHGLPVPLADIAAALRALFDVSLDDIAVGVWREARAVVDARSDTLANQGTRKALRLSEHVISHTWQPQLEVTVHGVQVGHPVTLDLTLELKVHLVTLTVLDGEIVAVDPGPAQAAAKLSIGGRTLAERQLVDVHLGPVREVARTRPSPAPV